MSDVAIPIGVTTDVWQRSAGRSPYVWVTGQRGYFFRLRSGTGNNHARRVDYIFTGDAGLGEPWDSDVEVFDTGGNTFEIEGVDVWYDRWTPGDTTGTEIHIFFVGEVSGGVNAIYISLDTFDDTLGTTRVVDTPGSGSATGYSVGITKLENGTLAIRYVAGTTTHEVWISTDSGATWAQLSADPGQDDAGDRFVIFPTASADNDDIMCLEWEVNQDDVFVNVWDDSAGTWTQTVIGALNDFVWTFVGAGQGDLAGVSNFWSSTFRQSDKTVILAIHEDKVGVSHDLRIFTIKWDGTTLTITEKTRVLTATSTVAGVAILIDNNNDDLYVTYLDGTDGSVVVQQVKSTDGGDTWGSPIQVSDDDTDYGIVFDTPQITGEGRVHPLFGLDLGTDRDLSIRQKSPGGFPIPVPIPITIFPSILSPPMVADFQYFSLTNFDFAKDGIGEAKEPTSFDLIVGPGEFEIRRPL